MDSITKAVVRYEVSEYRLKLARRIQDVMKKHRGEYARACADIIEMIADDKEVKE